MAQGTEDAETVPSTGSIRFAALLGSAEPEGFSRADQAAHQLETAITVGLFRDGERLPSEPELASRLGVSTITLRQALASLRSRGIITTKRGRGGGSIVSDGAVRSPQDLARRLRAMSTEELRDLGDISAAVASASARLAATRADDQDIQRLRSLAEEFRQASDLDALRRTDSRFHIGLGVAAQSRRLTAATVQVQGEFAPLLWAPATHLAHTGTAADEHLGIVDAIAAGDAERAQALAIAHSERDAEAVVDAHLELVLADPTDG
ncbi:FadR/GntR family transcriptional regulator [Streptomyces phyllanthi]|uniref:FadR family transcriptional regulator n=1 Tax=Streptomyces phyllanthi TaxID=1803180 RepID=A0A5N8VVG0_9ACTN|nr:FCD domain-containing protein [Streptomyces phyllanthi]MPY39261.1 FadR family transcriptional regulator [Streptomyces phyllanthi]